MLVSPAEPAVFRELGTSSPLPESHGCDFLIASPDGLVGVQRKAVPDLLASIQDGRLTKETLQMGRLVRSILLIEGKFHANNEGTIINVVTNFTMTQVRGFLWTAMLEGWQIDRTDGPLQTVEYLKDLEKWSVKADHSALKVRPKEKSPWGHRTNKDFAAYVLQSVDGISHKMAKRIVDKYGLPLRLTVTAEQLSAVEGMGPKRVARMLEIFGGSTNE